MTSSMFDPVATSIEIEASYRRYLQTTHWTRDENLRTEFESALSERFALAKGPILQATVPYATGVSIKQLMDQGILNQAFASIPEDVFPINRPLYLHQQQAIEKSVAGRNMIVATGTGSGKTECFLLPVINHLLNERDAGTLAKPGVRAMFLYPMNALANDQMKRIRELLEVFPDITFGRFIGDTEDTFKKALPIHRTRTGDEPFQNELISREQIRENPPHILLTNYAMLEFLLLRPEDTSLFDGPTSDFWRFIALDEVHVYDGAQGAEIAMLLRRVRDRVNQSEKGKIRYIGTSATLGKGIQDYPKLAEFGEILFDERVESTDIIGATRHALAHGPTTWELSIPDANALAELIASGPDATTIRGYLTSVGAPLSDLIDDWRIELGTALEQERQIQKIQNLLESGSQDMAHMASSVFPGSESMANMSLFVFLGMQTISPRTGGQLIPARYHYLLRSLEGAYVCLSPHHPQGVARLNLSRHDKCPGCALQQKISRSFELGCCRKCGASYLVGKVEERDSGNGFENISAQTSSISYLLVDPKEESDGNLNLVENEEDEDESVVTTDDLVTTDIDERTLCTSCGALTEGKTSSCQCGEQLSLKVTVAKPSTESTDLRRCVSCSGRSTISMVTRFQTGQDAPVAVIATSLYQSLPKSSTLTDHLKPGEGRKLLSFADSRQDAAFFAPYLERTYSRAIERRLIWSVLRKNSDRSVRFEELVNPIRKLAEDSLVLDPDNGETQNASIVRSWLMREILAVDRRQSLDGVGLAELSVAIPLGVTPPPPLLEMGFSETECIDLLLVLLDSLRLRAAVSIPSDVNIKDEIFSPRNVATSARLEQSSYGIVSWVPSAGTNGRLDYLTKVLESKNIDVDARQLLSDLWTKVLTRSGSPWLKVFDRIPKRAEGEVMSLNPERITFRPASDEHQAFVCSKCMQIWWINVEDVCPTWKCDGDLELLGEDSQSNFAHYRYLYEQLEPIGLSVKEHTGQLENNRAAEIQQQFIDGVVNALSCSTTFELGVDVGEVQAVLMRNVPPTPANYVQRAGRAGRRAGSAALVVTFAQRRSHDLHYFAFPYAMVDGSVATPIVTLENPQIIRRHVHAIAFAMFEREQVDRGGHHHQKVGEFFESLDGSGVAPVDEFVAWLKSHPSKLGEAVSRVVPRGEDDRIIKTLGVEDWGWVEALTAPADHEENFGWLTRATEDARQEMSAVQTELSSANQRWKELTARNESKAALAQTKRMTVLQREQYTIQSRQLINYLAQRVVIPKYGFPVDVVTMDVLRDGNAAASRVDLSRDLRIGISEYAPGSQVIADGSYWEPIGLRRPASKHLSVRWWAICKECQAFQVGRGDDDFTCTICGANKAIEQGRVVKPEFGFIGQQSKEVPGEARPERSGFSSTHFSSYGSALPPEPMPMILGTRTIHYSFSRQGQITVINKGRLNRGFRVCLSCGRAEEAPKGTRRRNLDEKPHKRPNAFETECSQHFQTLGFAHQYLTDVVEIDLGLNMSWGESQSTLAALLAACPEIGITRDDVSGTLRSLGVSMAPSLMLIDAVPGGAGHATKIRENLEDLVNAAYLLVERCDCGLDTSCYACLRTYNNQASHDELVRGDALAILSQFR